MNQQFWKAGSDSSNKNITLSYNQNTPLYIVFWIDHLYIPKKWILLERFFKKKIFKKIIIQSTWRYEFFL